MNETGSVKFKCERVDATLARFAGFDELNDCRRNLLDLGMVGVDANGVGFGNLSVRDGTNFSRFYITGSGTGRIAELKPVDCARVVAYDFGKNWLRCEGSTVASSESLTHAAVYECDPTARAVIHCHDLRLWAALLNKVPTTSKSAKYGTPEMARATRRLFQRSDAKRARIFVMAAHEGGIVTFGNDLQEAFEKLKS